MALRAQLWDRYSSVCCVRELARTFYYLMRMHYYVATAMLDYCAFRSWKKKQTKKKVKSSAVSVHIVRSEWWTAGMPKLHNVRLCRTTSVQSTSASQASQLSLHTVPENVDPSHRVWDWISEQLGAESLSSLWPLVCLFRPLGLSQYLSLRPLVSLFRPVGLSHYSSLRPLVCLFRPLGLSHCFSLRPLVSLFGLSHCLGLRPLVSHFRPLGLSHCFSLRLLVSLFRSLGLSHCLSLRPLVSLFRPLGLSHCLGLRLLHGLSVQSTGSESLSHTPQLVRQSHNPSHQKTSPGVMVLNSRWHTGICSTGKEEPC